MREGRSLGAFWFRVELGSSTCCSFTATGFGWVRYATGTKAPVWFEETGSRPLHPHHQNTALQYGQATEAVKIRSVDQDLTEARPAKELVQ